MKSGGIEVAHPLVYGGLIKRSDARRRRQRHREAARQILDQPDVLEHVPQIEARAKIVAQRCAAHAPDQAGTEVGDIEHAHHGFAVQTGAARQRQSLAKRSHLRCDKQVADELHRCPGAA